MNFDLDHAIGILQRTPLVLRALLQDLPSEWVDRSEGEKTWSPYDVIGHLIHGERTDWIPRARIILSDGEARAFEPFDRFAQLEASKGKSLEELLSTFKTLRTENLRALKDMNLTRVDLNKTGSHPELGRVTMGQLLATWASHDLDHLVQIGRTMAVQYRDAVGPWRAFLSVMKQ